MERKTTTHVSTEAIIETLRMMRDKNIQEFIHSDDAILRLLNKHYNVVAMSPVKKEFLKRDLIDLKKSSLDLVHYSALIKEIKLRGGMELTGAQDYFLKELEGVFSKYV